MPGRRSDSTSLAVQRRAEASITTVRGQHVIIDTDLAQFYGVKTSELNRGAQRNAARFPEDFRFQLTPDQWTDLKRKNSISSSAHGGRRTPPWVYTEQGAIQAAGVIKSARADEVSVAVARAFVTMRDRLADLEELVRALPEIRGRIEALEGEVATLATDAANQHYETEYLNETVKSLKGIVKAMHKAERSLPPAM